MGAFSRKYGDHSHDNRPNWTPSGPIKGLISIIHCTLLCPSVPLLTGRTCLNTLFLQSTSVSNSIAHFFMHFQTYSFSAYLHDAIQVYAIGLNRSLSYGGNISDGLSIIGNVTNSDVLFKGIFLLRITVFTKWPDTSSICLDAARKLSLVTRSRLKGRLSVRNSVK